jgi:oligopeptide/dipeptide ABC transporter ATP-binding protein
MNALLSVRHLSTSFPTDEGWARAVDDVSFDLFPGETLGLVGESGCGKTVTALSMLRLIEGTTAHITEQSRVEYLGTNVLQLGPSALRKIRGAEIAMIFQDPTTSLNPVLTIGTQIVETLRAHRTTGQKAARARAAELLRLVGMPDSEERLDTYPHQLSGGMQQRVMIAIALSCEPRVLIADEPTTALDVTIQAQIIELLADLKRRLGMSMILITHDLGVVAGIADRVAVMYGGQIVEVGKTSTLFDHPLHPYTAALLRAIPRLDRPTKRLDVIPGSVPSATDWPTGCRFHPRCPHAWDRCGVEHPPLLTEPERGVRCWLAEEPHRRNP